jgi:hypothetical protein
MNIGEAIAILTEFAKVAGNETEMSVSSFNLQARVEHAYASEYMAAYRLRDSKRTTKYQVIASYPQTNNYDHIPEKAMLDKETS